MKKLLIVGLGNPENKYLHTKHNVGFEVIDFIVDKLSLTKKTFKNLAEIYEYNNVYFAKPLTYMNLSGNFVREFINYKNINSNDLVVIYDDFDFEVGTFKLKESGSSAGQKGIQNIFDQLETNSIKRIRIGIGKNNKKDSKNYVLSSFSSSDKKKIKSLEETIFQIIMSFIQEENFKKLMNKYNSKNFSNEK